MSMRYMECWKNIILLIVNNQKNPDRAVFWRRKQQKTGRIDRRDIRKLALHSIPFRQWTTQRARYRKQVTGGRGRRSQAARLQICFCGYFFFSSSDILQETWISGGFHPWGISVHREKALLHKKFVLTCIHPRRRAGNVCRLLCRLPCNAADLCHGWSCRTQHDPRCSFFPLGISRNKMPIFKRRNRIF